MSMRGVVTAPCTTKWRGATSIMVGGGPARHDREGRRPLRRVGESAAATSLEIERMVEVGAGTAASSARV